MTDTMSPIFINAEEASYASRPRLFWCNFPIQTRDMEQCTLSDRYYQLQGWATLKDNPPWHHTGFVLPGERAYAERAQEYLKAHHLSGHRAGKEPMRLHAKDGKRTDSAYQHTNVSKILSCGREQNGVSQSPMN